MKKLICFMLCISLLVGFIFGCGKTYKTSQSERLIESQSESARESASESRVLSESENVMQSESERESASESESQSVTNEEEKENPKGILSLQKAFDLGLLTHEDLLNIAYHSDNVEINEEIDSNFEPIAKPEMTEEIVLDIASSLSYIFNYLDLITNETTVNDFDILSCYAFVNGYYVLNYRCDYLPITQEIKTEIVDGVKFENAYPIKVVQQKNEFMKAEAKQDYYEWWIKVIYPNAPLDQVAIVVFGIFDDCLIGYFVDCYYYLQDCHYEEFFGYGFWVSNGDQFLVWKDGEFAGVTFAYENEWITIEMIAMAHEIYKTGKGEQYTI